MWELIGQYYGIDWIAMVASVLFIYLVANQKREGFIWGVIANITWIILNLWAQIYAGVVLGVVTLIMNIIGFIKWGRENNLSSKQDMLSIKETKGWEYFVPFPNVPNNFGINPSRDSVYAEKIQVLKTIKGKA